MSIKEKAMQLELFPRKKILVEGGMQSDWQTNQTTILPGDIPKDVTRIKLLQYTLSLVGKWVGEEIDLSLEQDLDSGKTVQFEGEGKVWDAMDRPTTIITQDGRIFHDIGLRNSTPNSERLANFLISLPVNFKDDFLKTGPLNS